MRQRLATVAIVFLCAFLCLGWTLNNHNAGDGIIDGRTIFDSDSLTVAGWIYTGDAISVRGAKLLTLIFETTRNTASSVVYGVYSSFDGTNFYRCDMLHIAKADGMYMTDTISHASNTVQFVNIPGANHWLQIQASTHGTGDGTMKVHMMATR